MTLSSKPEVSKRQRRKWRNEPLLQGACTKFGVKFSGLAFDLCERTRQTDRPTRHSTSDKIRIHREVPSVFGDALVTLKHTVA